MAWLHIVELLQPVLGVLVLAHVLAAAAIDVRSRRFPNALACSFALCCTLFSISLGGVERLLVCGVQTVICCAALVGCELLWRRAHDGDTGLGMGDIKFLAASMLISPLGALLSFSFGLVALALVGALWKKHSLPLLPFVASSMLVLFFVSNVA